MPTKRLKDMSFFFLSDSDGDNELSLNPDGRPCKDDVLVLVFLRPKSAFSWEEIAKILLSVSLPAYKC